MSNYKNMKITIELELSYEEYLRLLQNSIERVFNTAIQLGEWCERNGPPMIAELGSTSWQDCDELKPLANKIWWAAQGAVRDVTMRRGDNG